MNRLLESAPTALRVAGITWEIDPSWRNVLRTFVAFCDDECEDDLKMDILLYNLYTDFQQSGFEEMSFVDNELKALLAKEADWFLRCGSDEKERKEPPTVDFRQDHQRIHEAFLKKGVDLDRAQGMHWWIFMGHFAELPECTLTRYMYLRYLRNSGKLSKKEHKHEQEEWERIGDDVLLIHTPQPDGGVFDWLV